ncbi:uncharacterized protein [Aquarana catesbeiana]|uniref:uncharacterized protein n=1 Tax=Aquarana catesbeiana TaxID=8400 RepID=UPI003CC977A1
MRASNPSILIVWSSLIQVASGYLFGPRQVTGSLGGSVTVSCYYSSISANIHGRKFWCKVHKRQCYTIVSTTPYIKENDMNRTYLQDFTNNFMINMTSLQPEDSGAYRCGIGNSNHGLYYPVNVTVSQGKKVPSSSEIFIGRLRGSLVIPCRALAMPHNGTLYWCKVTNTKSAVCDTIINSSGQVNSHFWGRVLIQEESNTTGFNILVNDLRMSDSGFYHCGAYSPTEELDWKDVHVHIINEPTRRKMFRPLTTSQSLHVKCQVPKDFASGALTYWCKWSPMGCPPLLDSNGFIHEDFKSRISLVSDNSTIRAYTVTMNHLEVGDSGWYWCVTTDGLKVESSSMDVIVLATTTRVYSTSSSTDLTSDGTHPTDLHPITEISTIQDSGAGIVTVSPIYRYSSSAPPSSGVTLPDNTAVLYSESSSRGQPSTEFSTETSNPVTSTDSRQEISTIQDSGAGSVTVSPIYRYSSSAPPSSGVTLPDNTAVLYSESSSRGQPSTEFSTETSNPVTSTDSRQEISTIQDSGAGSVTVSPIYRYSSSAPPSSGVTLPDNTAVLYSESSSRGQPSTEFSTETSNPVASTDRRQEISTIQDSGAGSVTVSPIYRYSSSAPPSSGVTLPDNTAVLYSESSSRGQPSTEFSTETSNPVTSTDRRQEISTIQDSGAGSVTVSPIYRYSSSAPPSSGVTLPDNTAVLYSESSSRGQPSTEFSTETSNPVTSTDRRQELSTVQSISTTNNGGASTISPIQNYSHSAPPSNVSMQDSSALQYSTSTSRGQRSTEFSPMSSNPVRGTDSTQERTPALFFSPTSRSAVSSASSAAAKGISPSRSSRTQITHESGAPSTLGPQRVLGTTRRTVNSTLYRQPVSGRNESRNESLVSRHKNLYPILIPVLVIACISILATVFAIHVKGQKKKAAIGPTTEPEHIAMIDGEAKPENTQHNDSSVVRLADPEDLSGETDV